MPINKYFKGHGDEVMASMNKTYSNPKKAKSVFYATANKNKQTPAKKSGGKK
jgi:hypothetical protein